MTSYARIVSGLVLEIIPPVFDAEGEEVPIAARFTPDIAAEMVAIPQGTAVLAGYTYDGALFTPPVSSLTLAQAKTQALAALASTYTAAIAQPVTYASKGGATETYQADPASISNLQSMLLAFGATQTLPAGFYWVAADNTQVPFTYADLQGLAQVMGTQGAGAFMHLQTLKATVLAATTVAAVQAVTW